MLHVILVTAYVLFGMVVLLTFIMSAWKFGSIFSIRKSAESFLREKFPFDLSYLSYQLLLSCIALLFFLALLNATSAALGIYSEKMPWLSALFEIEKEFAAIGYFGQLLILLLVCSFIFQFYSRYLISKRMSSGKIPTKIYDLNEDRSRLFTLKIGIAFVIEILWLAWLLVLSFF